MYYFKLAVSLFLSSLALQTYAQPAKLVPFTIQNEAYNNKNTDIAAEVIVQNKTYLVKAQEKQTAYVSIGEPVTIIVKRIIYNGQDINPAYYAGCGPSTMTFTTENASGLLEIYASQKPVTLNSFYNCMYSSSL